MSILELGEEPQPPQGVMDRSRYKTPTKNTPVKIEHGIGSSLKKPRAASLATSSKKASTMDSSKKASRASPMRAPSGQHHYR